MKYLNPKADLTIKRVFGEHPDLMMSLLNALLPLTAEQEITDIEYLPSEMMPEHPLRKYSIVDVRCTDKESRQFLVEIQTIWSPEFEHRVSINDSKVYVRQTNINEQYELPQPVYSLNLLNQVFEPELEGYYHHYQMIHVENSDKVIDSLQLVFIELPKFTPHSYAEKKMQVLWLQYLTEIDDKTREAPQELMANPQVRKAIDALQVSVFTDAQLAGYEKFWDIVSVERTLYYSAKRRGMAAGMAAGMAEERHLIALNMKKQGVAFELISQCTGLPMKEIELL